MGVAGGEEEGKRRRKYPLCSQYFHRLFIESDTFWRRESLPYQD
jgi:hypothetical protein